MLNKHFWILIPFVLATAICQCCAASDATLLKSGSKVDELRRWYILPFASLAQTATDEGGLTIADRSLPGTTTEVTDQQRERLTLEIRHTIRLLLAPDYSTYWTALNEYFQNGVTFTESGRRNICARLRGFAPTEEVVKLSTKDLLERYWTMKTRLGISAEHFANFVPSETYYVLTTVRDIEPWNPVKPFLPFPEDARKHGHFQDITSFDFQVGDPVAIAKSEALYIADLRIMIHTSEPDLAYPIAVRYWWSATRNAWIPWAGTILYVGPGRAAAFVF